MVAGSKSMAHKGAKGGFKEKNAKRGASFGKMKSAKVK